jgi:hypothetical protein
VAIRVLLASAFLIAICFSAAAVMPTYLSFGIAIMAIGWCAQTFMTTANSTVQLWTEPAMRGRVMAIYMAIVQGCTPLGAPLVGRESLRGAMVADGGCGGGVARDCGGDSIPGEAPRVGGAARGLAGAIHLGGTCGEASGGLGAGD